MILLGELGVGKRSIAQFFAEAGDDYYSNSKMKKYKASKGQFESILISKQAKLIEIQIFYPNGMVCGFSFVDDYDRKVSKHCQIRSINKLTELLCVLR